MSVAQLERVGEYITIREAARIKGCSSNAFYLYLLRNDRAPRSKVGQTTVVRLSDIVDYSPQRARRGSRNG
jgi:hypothetical protein